MRIPHRAWRWSLVGVWALVVSIPAGLSASQAPQSSPPDQVDALKTTLPAAGKLVGGKPAGDGWVDLLASKDDWNAESEFWQFADGVFHGESKGGPTHHYAWTKKSYTDFELNVVLRMSGQDANSGVCIRLRPTTFDDAPGYQVDMGEGYWGSLWEERRAGMVQKFPDDLAHKLVHGGDWNHYYVVAKGHHIQAWLNGVKTIDIVHEGGFLEGVIGFQLCHGDKHTIVDVKTLAVRTL